ncbi:hypothetical protein N7510_000497 [Penicillium lagena]|uniref:uncharacterized protein n=1 Tax=Penicillium lagena TaxID=94218 RepID=UPI0025406A5D|nr:uncharacterized protein N7510_000497 [Penicillium lagena]KAJ5624188.1 hypothetical protein N7510_000497 [Penicillium lagena]
MSQEPASKIDVEEDTVFEDEADVPTIAGGAIVVIEKPSLELLQSSPVDYTTQLMGIISATLFSSIMAGIWLCK